MNKPTPPKRGRGRPPRDASGPQVKRTVNFTPTEVAHLERTYGTVQAGVRALVAADVSK